ATALRKEVCAGPFRERHALSFEEFFRAFTIHELLAAGRFLRVFTSACGKSGALRLLVSAPLQQRSARSYRAGADETRWNAILFRDQIVALFGDRNDRYSVRFDFYFQS